MIGHIEATTTLTPVGRRFSRPSMRFTAFSSPLLRLAKTCRILR